MVVKTSCLDGYSIYSQCDWNTCLFVSLENKELEREQFYFQHLFLMGVSGSQRYASPFWRNNDVIITSCSPGVLSMSLRCHSSASPSRGRRLSEYTQRGSFAGNPLCQNLSSLLTTTDHSCCRLMGHQSHPVERERLILKENNIQFPSK